MEQKPEAGGVEMELKVMRHVVEALAALPDENARGRVLRWAAEHLTISQAAAHASASRSTPESRLGPAETADLNLEGLESLFEAEVPTPEVTAKSPAAAEPVASQPRSNVKGFQRPAQNRQSA